MSQLKWKHSVSSSFGKGNGSPGRRHLLKSDSQTNKLPEQVFSRLLSEDYNSDALAFLSEAVDVILQDQSNIWVS